MPGYEGYLLHFMTYGDPSLGVDEWCLFLDSSAKKSHCVIRVLYSIGSCTKLLDSKAEGRPAALDGMRSVKIPFEDLFVEHADFERWLFMFHHTRKVRKLYEKFVDEHYDASFGDRAPEYPQVPSHLQDFIAHTCTTHGRYRSLTT